MTSDDTGRWKVLFGQLLVIHGKEWDKALSRFYFDALKDCDFVEVQATGEHLMRTSTWFPKPAEWREAIGICRFNARLERQREFASRRLHEAIQCDRCNDTGMRPSDRDETRYTHCECRERNENYLIEVARRRLGDDELQTPHIPATESQRILDTVKDFKRLQSGE